MPACFASLFLLEPRWLFGILYGGLLEFCQSDQELATALDATIHVRGGSDANDHALDLSELGLGRPASWRKPARRPRGRCIMTEGREATCAV